MKKSLIGVTVAALVLASSTASAQLGAQGELTVAAERLFGLRHIDSQVGDNPHENHLELGAGWQPSTSRLHHPRLGVDYFVTDHLSLGGSGGFFLWTDDAGTSGILLQPRVGYTFDFNEKIGFWLRGGLTYVGMGDDNNSYSQFSFSVDSPFYFFLSEDVALLVAPTLDVGLTGEHEWHNGQGVSGTEDYDEWSTGAYLGLLAAF